MKLNPSMLASISRKKGESNLGYIKNGTLTQFMFKGEKCFLAVVTPVEEHLFLCQYMKRMGNSCKRSHKFLVEQSQLQELSDLLHIGWDEVPGHQQQS